MAFIRKFAKRICIIANLVVVALFLLACANSFLDPGRWWIISLLGLVFPLLLVLVTGFGLFWLFFYSRRLSLISAVALVIGWPNIHTFFAFNLPRKFVEQKPAGTLRVLTWNVRRWDEFITKKAGASGHRIKMIDFLQQQDADIMCFQEFFEPHNARGFSENITYIQQQLGYPYYFFSHDYKAGNGMFETGVIIFSKFPIIYSEQIKYNSPDYIRGSESLIFADLDVNGKTIRVFTTHLQSVLFRNKDFRDFEIIRNVDDSMIEASKSIAKKLKRAYSLRSSQADLVRAELDRSPYPLVMCGDFNDVPNSYAYFRIRGNRRDAFSEKGFGIGRTYVHLSPTLRIDYILTDQQFKVAQVGKFPLPYSDHHPLVADLQLP
jgi:endonuclease/exonuclease/phosphatase family metal-dependent hydrolase